MNENFYYKLLISHKETSLCLTLLFTSRKMEFNPLSVRHATVSKHLSTLSNISEATALTYFSFSDAMKKLP